MKTILGVIALFLLLTISPLAFADEKSGEWWEVTTKMEMPGMPEFSAMMPGGHPTKVCLPTERDEQPFQSQDQDCTTSDVENSGDSITFKMTCTGDHPMTGTGEGTFSRDNFHQKMKMQSDDGEMLMTIDGKRIGGECKVKEAANQPMNHPVKKQTKTEMKKDPVAEPPDHAQTPKPAPKEASATDAESESAGGSVKEGVKKGVSALKNLFKY